jgi:hypothetical protein
VFLVAAFRRQRGAGALGTSAGSVTDIDVELKFSLERGREVTRGCEAAGFKVA